MALFMKFLKSSGITLIFLMILLFSAGRLDYWQAWMYVGVSLLMNLATQLVLRGTPDLSKERSKPGGGIYTSRTSGNSSMPSPLISGERVFQTG